MHIKYHLYAISKGGKEMAEYIDVLNEDGVKTGEILTRKEIHQRGLWHRAIVVIIVNENNEILLQQRSANKDKNANLWDISVAGHISAGQDAISAAAREINEEVMIDVEAKVTVTDFRYMFSYRVSQIFTEDYIENQFYDVFILRKNGIRKKHIRMQESEVQAVKFVDLIEIQKMIENNQIVERNEVYQVLTNFLFRF